MPLVSAHPLLRLRAIALNPAEDSAWVDLDATLLCHLGQVAIADPILTVPTHAQQDDLDWKAATLEQG
jgi:hypothetical protein